MSQPMTVCIRKYRGRYWMTNPTNRYTCLDSAKNEALRLAREFSEPGRPCAWKVKESGETVAQGLLKQEAQA